VGAPAQLAIAAPALFPRIETARLRLRAFRLADAAEVQRLAGDRAVAEGTLLPHPYEGGIARAWIWDQAFAYAAGRSIDFAIERAADGALAGAIGLEIDRSGRSAKLGLWLGRAHWGHGYATEAVHAVLGYGFAVLELERIFAPRFRWNAASARVLEKAGLAQEGSRREYVAPRGREETIETHGILRWEWEARAARPQGVAPAELRRGDGAARTGSFA
jgi:RimJ/RimL family protein N-acetyltransferase